MALKDSEIGTRRWRKIRERILIRDGYTCIYCGENADQVDHVIARARGGNNDESNLVASCKRCNTLKGAQKGLFLGPRATPHVPAADISLITRSETHSGPFAGQPRQDQTG